MSKQISGPLRNSLHVLKNLSSSKYFKGAALISLGTVLGQVVLMGITVLFLKDIYTPDVFGVQANLISISFILSYVATLKMESAIPLSKGEDKYKVLGIALISVVVISIVVVVICLGINIYPEFRNYLGVSVLIMGCYNVFRAWNLDHEKFRNVGLSNFLRPFFQAILQLCLGLILINKYDGLIYGFLIAYAISVIVLLWSVKLEKKRVFSKAEYIEQIIIHKQIPLYNLPAVLITTLGTNFVPVILTILYSTNVTGQYGMLASTVGFPLGLVGAAVAQVFFPRVAKIDDLEGRRRLVERSIIYLYGISFLFFIPVIFYSKPIILAVLGKQWSLTAEFAGVMSISYLFSMVSSPISSYALVSKNQKTATVITIVETITRFIVLYLGYYFLNSPMLSISLYAIACTIIYIYYINWILRLLNSSLIDFIKRNIGYFRYDLLFVIIVLTAQYFGGTSYAVLIFIVAFVFIMIDKFKFLKYRYLS
ncbi:MATE family efflux transporter [Solitalea canadensis]|uniref:hypothetical protein n=1 Tax=Solitalea canadensis TaxID=995 RepID=UPI0012FA49C6|nr:hypothetical protein [Solitalea canadensis]